MRVLVCYEYYLEDGCQTVGHGFFTISALTEAALTDLSSRIRAQHQGGGGRRVAHVVFRSVLPLVDESEQEGGDI
jgi:hypothetical protein